MAGVRAVAGLAEVGAGVGAAVDLVGSEAVEESAQLDLVVVDAEAVAVVEEVVVAAVEVADSVVEEGLVVVGLAGAAPARKAVVVGS